MHVRYFFKISGVKIFKRLVLLPEFSPNFSQTLQKACNQVKYRLFLFLVICQILKVYGTLKISYHSYIAIIHKAMFVSSCKGQADVKAPGPLVHQ